MCYRRSKYPCWFSNTLKYCISKKIPIFVFTRRPSLAFIIIVCFTFFCIQVKVTIKSDRQQWLKFIDDSLRTNPHHFCKLVSNYKRKDNAFLQLQVDNQYVTDLKLIADAFANHFKSTLNTNYQSITPKAKVKQSLYTPWRRLGERRYSSYSFTTSALDGGE
jgi:hypothetical protein